MSAQNESNIITSTPEDLEETIMASLLEILRQDYKDINSDIDEVIFQCVCQRPECQCWNLTIATGNEVGKSNISAKYVGRNRWELSSRSGEGHILGD